MDNVKNNSTKMSLIKEDSSNLRNSPANFENEKKDNSLSGRIRKISQPLMKKKSVCTLEHNSVLDPYITQSNEHHLHTLNQKTPLLEQKNSTPPKRKLTFSL